MTISHSITAALCVLGSLTGAAHGSNINGEASYISFKVSAAVGTYPMAINSSMTVSGYYLATYNEAHGFIRTADGTIDTFDVAGAVWTQPESINAAGDCQTVETGGFVMSPEGVISVFEFPGATTENYTRINEVGDVTGAYTDTTGAQHGFVRNPYGTITTFDPPEHDPMSGTQPTSINDAGAITGFFNQAGVTGFLRVPLTGTSTQQ